MTEIVFYKWQPGFDKIGFYRLLRKELGYSLATAKQTVDLLMEGKTIKIELTSLELAEQILRQAEQLGAVGGKVDIARQLLEQLFNNEEPSNKKLLAANEEEWGTNREEWETKRWEKKRFAGGNLPLSFPIQFYHYLPMKYHHQGDIRDAR